MLLEFPIPFHVVANNIQNVLAHGEIGFEERDQILAIVWIYPDAVLKLAETD